MIYEFSYRDNEGDEYSSEEHATKQAANKEWEEIKRFHDNDCHIIETWIYDDEGNFIGRYRVQKKLTYKVKITKAKQYDLRIQLQR